MMMMMMTLHDHHCNDNLVHKREEKRSVGGIIKIGVKGQCYCGKGQLNYDEEDQLKRSNIEQLLLMSDELILLSEYFPLYSFCFPIYRPFQYSKNSQPISIIVAHHQNKIFN